MDRAVALREHFYEDSEGRTFARPQRCNSLPTQEKERWVPPEKPGVLGTKPSRSISLTSKLVGRPRGRLSRLAIESRPEPIGQDLDADSGIGTEEDGYGSDDEDKRNGVTITYSQDHGCAFHNSMRDEMVAEFQRLTLHGNELAANFRSLGKGYMKLRQQYFEHSGMNWTSSTWHNFLLLDNAISTLQQQLFDIQENLEHRYAEMFSFLDHVEPTEMGAWVLQENGTAVWTLEGIAEQARDDEYPVLEWNGIDYNSLD